MPLKIVTKLNASRLAQVRALIGECAACDRTEYSFYMGEEGERDFFALYYERGVLVGYAFLCMCEPAELSGVVRPSARRRHIFTRMAKGITRRAQTEAYEFSGRDGYPGFAECAVSLGAPRRREEHLMQFGALSLPDRAKTLRYRTNPSEGAFVFFTDENLEVGRATLVYDGSAANICNVYVEPALRGSGYGYAILRTVLSELAAQKISRILLQVSGNNQPALALYAKCGFEIIDSVVFYSRLE